jgi:hypothetical protein
VFEFLAPTVYPSCGTAALLIFLPGAELGPVGGYVATQLYDVGGPIFAICGAVSRPPATYECLLDTQQQAILNTLEANAAGTTVPLGLRPVGSLVEQTIVVQDKLPPLQQQLPAPANSLNAGNLAVQFLVCSPVIDTPPETNDFFPPIAQPSSEPFVSQPSAFVPGTAGTPARTLGGTAGIPTSVLPRTIRPSSPVGDGVRYAAVWLLPLALLAMFGYLGGAFNREVTPPPA